MRKIRLVSILLAAIVMLLALPGVANAAAPIATATGGGWFYSASSFSTDHKVSFTFTAALDDSGNIGGVLQAVDHEDDISVHGSFTWYPFLGIDPVGSATVPPNVWMFGDCRVNGEGGYFIEFAAWDYRENGLLKNDDWAVIKVYDSDWTLIYEWYNELSGGNIVVKKPYKS